VRVAHEVAVAAALPRAWAALLDVGRWAGTGVDGMHRASGAVAGERYAGTVGLVDADDDEHVARFRVLGRGGVADVTVRARARGRSSALAIEADVRPAPDGDVVQPALAALVDELAARLAGEPEPLSPTALGGSALQPVLERAALIAAGIAVGVLLGRAVRRR
jgi:hypothetical protein